jgi:hypothetical protein
MIRPAHSFPFEGELMFSDMPFSFRIIAQGRSAVSHFPFSTRQKSADPGARYGAENQQDRIPPWPELWTFIPICSHANDA